MTPATKKLTLYGLAVGLHSVVMRQEPTDDAHAWRALKLAEVGQAAIDNCKSRVDKSRLREVKKKIDELLGGAEELEIVGLLSFLLCGVSDLDSHTSGNLYLDAVGKRALWFMELFDPKLDKTELYEQAAGRYEIWSS